VTFVCVGKNAASTGFALGVDNLILARTGPDGWKLAATTHAPNVPTGVTALTASLSDPDAVVRGLCALDLAKLGPAASPALPALIARLEDSDPSVRMASATAIGAIGPGAASAVPALVAACQAPGQALEVVRESATALGAIGPAASSALPALKKIAAKPIPHVGGVIDLTPAWAASRAIRQIEAQPSR
jgi:hypothetical protein